jgi:hypothetical protein
MPVSAPRPAEAAGDALPSSKAPGLWARIKTKVAAARTAIVERCRTTRDAISITTQRLSMIMPLRRIVLVALGVGVVVAALGYTAPAGVAAMLAGVGGVVTAVVAQVGSWFRRSTQMFRTS